MEQSRLSALDLNEIVVFAKVVQTGSFTRAARELGMPKSTVSRKVSELEAQLQARLLQRTTRKLGLTDAGRAFYPYSARIVAEVEEARRAVGDLQGVPRGLLRVTAPLSLDLLGPIIAGFLAQYPEVELDVLCTDRLVDLVEEGFDVSVRAGRLADSTLVARSLGTLQRKLVAAPKYLARRRAPRTPSELAKHDCLVFGPTAPRQVWQLEGEGGSVDVAVRARMVSNDLNLLREAVLTGQGIMLLPAPQCAEEVKAGRLRAVLPNYSSVRTPLSAVYPSTRHLSPKVSAFVEHLQTALSGRAAT